MYFQKYWSYILSGMKNRFCQCAGLEQDEAQKQRVPRAAPNSGVYVRAGGNGLYQHGVNPHAAHNG